MKNFQVKHGQYDSIISPKTFSFKSSKRLADRRIVFFWQVLESIHKFIIEIHVLECLFVTGSNKKQRKARIVSNFTKGGTFHLLWQPSVLEGNLAMWSPPLEENIPGYSIERKAYWFALKTAWVLPIPSDRVRIGWWTFL